MTSKLLRMSLRLAQVKENADDLSFPGLVIQLRKALDKSRASISRELDIPYNQLLRMEEGIFLVFKQHRIESLAEYFGIDKSVLFDKCHEFLAKRKEARKK